MKNSDWKVDDDFLCKPVLVYGPRKAGTSLMQNLLDGGTRVLMVPGELKLKVFVRKLEMARADPAGLFVSRGRSIFPSSMSASPEVVSNRVLGGLPVEKVSENLDLEKYHSKVSEIQNHKELNVGEILKADVAAFVSALREETFTAERWASKEVGGDPYKILELFRRYFPQGRIVFSVRQPEFIVRSILLNRRRKGVRLSIRRIFHECQDAQRIINYAHERAIREDIVVAYEQLTSDTIGEVTRVCEFLGIPFEEELTKPTTLGHPVVVDTSSQQTTQVFRQPSHWQKDLTLREMTTIHCFQIFAPLWGFVKGRPFVKYDRLMAALNLAKSNAVSK